MILYLCPEVWTTASGKPAHGLTETARRGRALSPEGNKTPALGLYLPIEYGQFAMHKYVVLLQSYPNI